MADWRLDQRTEETPVESDITILSRGTSTFKTTFKKIKDFIIGTTTLTTTDTTVTGAIEEVKGIADNNTTQLNDITNDLTFKSENIIPLSGWLNTDDLNPPIVGKSLRNICFLADLKSGITTNDTKIMQLPTWAYPFRTRSFPVMSCGEDWLYKIGVITITTEGEVVLSGSISNTKLTIAVSYQV